MKKKVVLLLIQILLVAMALALTVTTYAWYSTQTSVTVSKTTITATAGANTTIDFEQDKDFESYMGQTGQGAPESDDAPYSVSKKLSVTFNPISDNSALCAKITFVQIKQTTGKTATSDIDPDIIENFTWRIKIGEDMYRPDKNGFAVRESDGEYYIVTGSTTVSDIEFELYFLDEEGLQSYFAEDYDSINKFKYSGYENMRAIFVFRFEIGVDVLPSESAEEGTP